MIRLVAIDLDGTLLDSHWRVPEANRRAIARAIESGIHVALATGRRFEFTRAIVEQLPPQVGLIVNNGALIKRIDGTALLRRLLPRETARAVLEATRAFRAGAALVFDRPAANQIIYERIDWEDPRRSAYFERNRQYLGEMSPLEAALTEDPIQVMYTGGAEQMREVVACLHSLAFANEFSVAYAEYVERDFTIVDVIERSCSKASALAEWARRLGIGREQILAIGDNYNDWEMLQFAGTAVVMANAVPELKSMGWPVTLSNDEAGVAAAFERYVFPSDRC